MMGRRTRTHGLPLRPPIKLSELTLGTISRFASYADHCHVSWSNLRVARSAVSRLRDGAWRHLLTRGARRELLRHLFARHNANLNLYLFVQRGGKV